MVWRRGIGREAKSKARARISLNHPHLLSPSILPLDAIASQRGAFLRWYFIF